MHIYARLCISARLIYIDGWSATSLGLRNNSLYETFWVSFHKYNLALMLMFWIRYWLAGYLGSFLACMYVANLVHLAVTAWHLLINTLIYAHPCLNVWAANQGWKKFCILLAFVCKSRQTLLKVATISLGQWCRCGGGANGALSQDRPKIFLERRI